MGIKVDDIKIGNRSVVAGAVNLPILKGDQGKEGEQGEQGIGIKSVEQIVTSTEDNGINIIEVTLENEIKSTFEVRNGSRGDGQGGSYDDTEIKKELQNKVDKVTGKSLILDSEIQRLSNVKNYDDTYVRQLISNKVDKVSGKSLVPDSEILRLSNLKNYDDTAIRELIDENLIEAKEYTDTEIANFDFVKIVSSLPTEGLPNKVYFVPKEESETNNIFEEYAWINGAWESFGTKTVEIDLTDVNADIEELQKNKADKTEIPTQISDLEDNNNQLVPTGGNKGQLLAKRSDLSNDTEWIDNNGDGILTGSVIGYSEEEIPEGYEEVAYPFMEEGTWTPEIFAENEADPTINYTTQFGTYHKIGKLVYVSFAVRGKITALNGTNHYARIRGLPFPATSLGSYALTLGGLYSLITKEVTDNIIDVYKDKIRIFSDGGLYSGILKVTSTNYFDVRGNGWYVTD